MYIWPDLTPIIVPPFASNLVEVHTIYHRLPCSPNARFWALGNWYAQCYENENRWFNFPLLKGRTFLTCIFSFYLSGTFLSRISDKHLLSLGYHSSFWQPLYYSFLFSYGISYSILALINLLFVFGARIDHSTKKCQWGDNNCAMAQEWWR